MVAQTFAISNVRGDGTNIIRGDEEIDLSKVLGSGDDISESIPLGGGGGKGYTGVLPRGADIQDIGAALKPDDFEVRPWASQVLDYTDRVLDLCQPGKSI